MPSAISAVQLQSMRILIVDDDPILLSSLKTALKYESYAVDTAGDGETATSLACVNDYDLIILDYNLPKKNGEQVCSHIRGRGKYVPILVLSINHEVDKKVSLLNLGADDYLTKPFSTAELLARLRALTRRPSLPNNTIYKIDDVVLDTAKQVVHRGKYFVDLSRKQYMLLEYLIRRPDEIITRAQIMEHVWDMNADVWSNTLEAHICELRKQLDIGNRHKLIHTVQGRGYRLSVKI